MKASELRCRLCGKNMFETGGYLKRVNAKGCDPIVECSPNCQADLPPDVKVLLAIEGEGDDHA